jgi:uncharacterized protein
VEHKEQGKLSVSGQGAVPAKPDIARVTLGAVTEAKFAADAVRDNAEVATKIIGMIETLDVPPADIRTAGLSVYAIVDANGVTTGYRAQNSIIVSVPVDKAGRVYDTGIGAGATQASDISFALRDDTAYRRQAVQAALAAARRDADAAADALGLRLSTPSDVEVDGGSSPILFRGMATRAADTPVLPGDLTVSATVRVIYNY